MIRPVALQDAIDALARDPLRNIVLLKQLLTHREHARIHRASGDEGAATLVTVETSVSPYDRQAYPRAALAAFIASDHRELTASLVSLLPRGVGIVFKLSQEADLEAVRSQFRVERRTAFVSFTADGGCEAGPGVEISLHPGDRPFALFEAQGHERAWLEPLLRGGKAFACTLRQGDEVHAACFSFENYGTVWEVGGVVTAPAHRRKGLGARIVRTALAELATRGLTPRYQVEEHNEASIRLARSVGLAPFLTIVHYEHEC